MAQVDSNTKFDPGTATITANNPPTGTGMNDTGSVEKIRDILFGNQMRDFEKRFSLMEERLAKTAQDLRDETQKRLETLELFFKKEMEFLKNRMVSEADERSQGDRQLSDEINKTSISLKKNIAQIEEKFSEYATDLRQQILELSKTLTKEIQTKNDRTVEALRNNSRSLDEAKVDRMTLAEYFIQIAMHLSDRSDEEAPQNGENQA